MYITNLEITNYKSYRKSGFAEFKPGFNIITGQNSAGKTALLEALTPQFPANPHRSLITIPFPGVDPPHESSVRLTLALSRQELLNTLSDGPHNFPRPADRFAPPNTRPFDASAESMDAFLTWLLNQPEFRIAIRITKSLGSQDSWFVEDPPLGLYPPHSKAEPGGSRIFIRFGVLNGRPNGFQFTTLASTADSSIALSQRFMSRGIYRFSAERFNVGQGAFGHNPVLAANANNLPEVLGILQHNLQRFHRFNEVISEILPQVRQVSVRPLPNNSLEIVVWPHDTDRADVTIPLNQCGSGIGQVLAIVYVVMTADHPQVIIVDEPQNFLHPGAIRKLVEFLKTRPQHQFIFATHSPTVIMASDPATITMTRLVNGETTFEKMDPSDRKDLQLFLAEVGVRLSDVFGADNILWVEGQTEEAAFPLIIRGVAKKSLKGTAILAVRQTGDLEGQDAKKILEIYNRLSSANALLPPAIAFVFDSECRTEQERTELAKLSRGLVRFLPRRMYENYLLNAAAVADVANSIPGLSPQPITEKQVADRIDAKRQELRHYCPGTVQIPDNWILGIHGANVLKEIFSELSENRAPFDKRKHSIAITEWLIANAPQDLQEIADLLVPLL